MLDNGIRNLVSAAERTMLSVLYSQKVKVPSLGKGTTTLGTSVTM